MLKEQPRNAQGHFSRKVTDKQVARANERIRAGELTVAQAARELGIARTVLWQRRKALR